MKVQESKENYLETILILSKRDPFVRSIDIANYMEFSKPSVSVAMSNLRAEELITVDEGGGIHLTDEGRKLAEQVYEKHTLLTEFLQGLGVSAEVAADDACRIEHVLSEESFAKFREHILAMRNHNNK